MKILQEGPLANFLSRLIDLILLNIVWFLCSLPVFTLGASTCAVYEVTMRYAFHGNPAILRTFFEAFYLAVLSHVFPVLAYFDTGIKESIRKAFFLSMKNGIFTVFIMVMNLLPVFAILLFPSQFGQIIFLYFVLGFSAIALLNSLHLVRLFDPERAEESEQIEERQRQLRNLDKQNTEEK